MSDVDATTIRAGRMKGEAGGSTGQRPTPPSGLSAVLSAMRTTRVGSLRGRRLLGMLVVVAMPLVVQTLVLVFGEGRSGGYDRYIFWMQGVFFGKVVPLVCIFVGTACLGDEWESGTAPFLIGSPVSRFSIATGRWLAALKRALLLVVPSALVLYVLCLSNFEGSMGYYAENLGWMIWTLVMLVAGYTTTFLFFGIALRHSIMASLVFLAVLEGLVANLPIGLAALSLGYQARNVMWQATLDDTFHAWAFDDLSAPATSVLGSHVAFVIWIAVFLGGTTWLLRRKESRGSASAAGDAQGAGA